MDSVSSTDDPSKRQQRLATKQHGKNNKLTYLSKDLDYFKQPKHLKVITC